MPAVNLKNMDVDALLGLRRDVESALAERARDLQRQLGLLGEGRKRGGRSAGRSGRASGLRGVKVPPKYRGPGGETWGREAEMVGGAPSGRSFARRFCYCGEERQGCSGRYQEVGREEDAKDRRQDGTAQAGVRPCRKQVRM